MSASSRQLLVIQACGPWPAPGHLQGFIAVINWRDWNVHLEARHLAFVPASDAVCPTDTSWSLIVSLRSRPC